MPRVLSLWQPWATLCVAKYPESGFPAKQVETRNWRPFELPVDVAIHATKKCDRDILDTITSSPFRETLIELGYYPGDPRPFERGKVVPPKGLKLIPFGAIIGVATVVEAIPTEDFKHERSRERAFGDYSVGRWAWILSAVRELPVPVPYTADRMPLRLLIGMPQVRVSQQLAEATI